MTIHNLAYLTSRNHVDLSLKGMLGKFYIISFTISHNWFVRPYPLLKTQFSIKNNLNGYIFITFPMWYSSMVKDGPCPEVFSVWSTQTDKISFTACILQMGK